ncbi:MAG: adenine deaminase [Bacillota bacterium]
MDQYHKKMLEEEKKRLAVAQGSEPADLLLKNGRIINVFTLEIEKGNVAISGERIAGVGSDYTKGRETVDLEGNYVAPGLIDAHLHVESTLLLPPELARLIVPHGTTAIINDPHEIANVMGVEGVELMLAASEGLPCDFFATVPSCVPTSVMETAGGEINAEQVSTLLAHPRVVGLGEMMNYPGVLNGNEEVLQKIFAAHRAGKVVDGHAPALSGRALQAYTGSGISTDHESITAVEAREKLRNGMKIIIRHGSATSSLADLLPLVTPASSDMFMFGSDDREAGELLEKGHLDELLTTAVELGAEPLTVVKVASYNAARHFRLYDRGAVAVGYRADLVIFGDLNEFPVQMVFKDGRPVARAGHMLNDVAAYKLPRSACCTVKLNRPLQEKDFTLSYPSEQVPVIGVVPGQLITEKLFIHVQRSEEGNISARPGPELNKIAVIERHGKGGGMTTALIKGLNLQTGAIASSVGHDSHNIIVVGASEKAMAVAVNELASIGGGFVVVGGDNLVEASLPLPVAGLMTAEKAETVAQKMSAVLSAAHRLGTDLPQPFLTLSFMALPVIPSLKITDRGLVDVDNFAFL